MSLEASDPPATLQVAFGCLIVSAHGDLFEDLIPILRDDVLQMIDARSCHGVVLDLTSVTVLDSRVADGIESIAHAAACLGARTVMIGIQPGLASALVTLNRHFHGIIKATNMERALEMLAR